MLVEVLASPSPGAETVSIIYAKSKWNQPHWWPHRYKGSYEIVS